MDPGFLLDPSIDSHDVVTGRNFARLQRELVCAPPFFVEHLLPLRVAETKLVDKGVVVLDVAGNALGLLVSDLDNRDIIARLGPVGVKHGRLDAIFKYQLDGG